MEASLQRFRDCVRRCQKEIIDCLLEEAIQLTHSKLGYFAVTDDAEVELTMLGWSKSAMAACATMEVPIKYPIVATGLWGDCLRERQAVITNDYENCTRVTKKGYPDGHVHVERHMNVPIMCGERIRGILGVGNKTEEYTAADAAALQAYANAAWLIFDQVKQGPST